VTTRLLASHVRQHVWPRDIPSLLRLARGTVSKILRQSQVRPTRFPTISSDAILISTPRWRRCSTSIGRCRSCGSRRKMSPT